MKWTASVSISFNWGIIESVLRCTNCFITQFKSNIYSIICNLRLIVEIIRKRAEKYSSRRERAEQTRGGARRAYVRAADTIRALRAVNVRSFQLGTSASVFPLLRVYISDLPSCMWTLRSCGWAARGKPSRSWPAAGTRRVNNITIIKALWTNILDKERFGRESARLTHCSISFVIVHLHASNV